MRSGAWVLTFVVGLAASAAACKDDNGGAGPADTGADATFDLGGETDVAPDGEPGSQLCPGVSVPAGCDVLACPSDDDRATLQRLLIETPADSVICFNAGTYSFDDELSLATRGITLRGAEDGVVFDFAAQTAGANGMSVTGDDFTIENLTLQNSPGDGIVVTGAENVVFRNLTVRWDGEPSSDNGAYAIYPVQCRNVLVEHCTVSGASDAGIYVGQSERVVVRHNTVFQNVAGIEIENSFDAEVYGNEAYDNTAGILVFNLENLPVKNGERTRLFDNDVHDNNHPNFAERGTTVAAVPPGVGIMVLAADKIEIHDNTLTNNGSAGVLVVSTYVFCALGSCGAPDRAHDRYPETIFIHGNTWTNNGQSPQGAAHDLFGGEALTDVVWDGAVDPSKPNEEGQLDLCIAEDAAVTFMNFDVLGGFEDVTYDRSPHDCTHEPLPPLDLFPED
jgi:parallel beta-helix repeat protein